MSTPPGSSVEQARPQGRRAAKEVMEKNSTRVTVPLLGTVTLPPPENVAFLGGIAALVALEVIEWPIGLALIAGHALATRSHNKLVQDFGRALEEA
jgi:hypothetical protein